MQLLGHMIFSLLLWHTSSSQLGPPPIAKPNCTTHCGNVSIPYPFGIGPSNNCYFDEWFQIDCILNSTSPSRSKPFLRRTKLEVLSIDIYGTLQIHNPVTFFSCKEKKIRQPANLTGSPFVYSQEKNFFIAVSCGFLATVSSGHDHVVGGCTSICQSNSDRDYDGCDIGINCCRTTIPPDLTVINSSIVDESGRGENKADCSNHAFLVDQEWFQHKIPNFKAVKHMDSVPVVLKWSISLDNNRSLIKSYVEEFKPNNSRIYNDSAPYCYMDNATSTYNNRSKVECYCPYGFEGSPYLLQPCQDIDECKVKKHCYSPADDLLYSNSLDPVWNISNALCENKLGGHICYSNITGATCEFFANGGHSCYFRSRPPTSRSQSIKPIVLGLGTGIGILLLLIGAWWAYKAIKNQRDIKRKNVLFKRNGGLLLEKQLSSGEVNVEKIKLFKSKELEKSTDNFSIDRILGQGGQGTVYKGMLADGKIVAVKKSKIVDKGKLSEFINEVVILSQISHRNVVQLLGCCLETEVPLLVYEFIPNGTLSHYIHEQSEDFPLTWEMRLRIATEIAGALSYLHSAASVPIYHRDVKSTNILLDKKYRAKVADFGTSRTIAIDQTHLTTNVHGTFGYLDPEYFQSSQFTEKSDVYSFGVVLVELLTGQKPISSVTRSTGEEVQEYRSLATYFIISMQEDRLLDILDARVLKEGSETEIRVVANLASRCLNLNGRNRPTMREVTAELEGIQMLTEKSSNAQQKYEGSELANDDSIEHWDAISSSEGGADSASDGGPTSSLLELPQISVTTW